MGQIGRMDMWSVDTLRDVVCNWEVVGDSRVDGYQIDGHRVDGSLVDDFVGMMNSRFPPKVFREHLDKRRRGIANAIINKELLDGAVQSFPDLMDYQSIEGSFDDLAGFGIVFTAGGEGERLRLSLVASGVPEESLRDFTKATYPIKGVYGDFGALQVNLAMVGWICSTYSIDIPVIVTTGPRGSVTDRVIPKIISKYKNFGIRDIMIIPQDERLHFTIDEKIAVQLVDGKIVPITHPDETGGPLMKLKQLSSHACKKLLIIQATALYDPSMLYRIAAAAKGHDCVGVGIPRSAFFVDDPFGTFVIVEKNGERALRIVEQGVRNDETRAVIYKGTGAHLPFNTGFYAVDCRLREDSELPDDAKIGYAATDILPLAKRPIVLTVAPDMYAVIKAAEDLESMAEAADRFGLREAVSKY